MTDVRKQRYIDFSEYKGLSEDDKRWLEAFNYFYAYQNFSEEVAKEIGLKSFKKKMKQQVSKEVYQASIDVLNVSVEKIITSFKSGKKKKEQIQDYDTYIDFISNPELYIEYSLIDRTGKK